MSELRTQINIDNQAIPFNEVVTLEQNDAFASLHWMAHSFGENHFSFAQAGDQNKPNAIHINRNKFLGFNFAEFAGEPFIQYNDMIRNDTQPVKPFLDNFSNYLKANKFDALHLHNVRADAHIFEYFKNSGIILSQKLAPYLELTAYQGFDAYFKSLSKQTRYMYNRLHRKHECEYNIYVDEQISTDIVDQVIDQKLKQLDLRGETSRVFSNKIKLDQLKNRLTTPSADFKTYVTLFKVDGVLASSTVFFIRNKVIYFYILAMDDSFAKLSPGNNIVLQNIKTGFELNCKTFDFLAPNDLYKLKWSRGTAVQVYDILVPITAKGKLFGLAYLRTIRPLLKNIYLFVKKLKFSKPN